MIFDKLFKKNKKSVQAEKTKQIRGNISLHNQERKIAPSPAVEVPNAKKLQNAFSAPEVSYVHTAQNRDSTYDVENNVIVLYWIAKKKKGFDLGKNNYPKWFMKTYGIDFEHVMLQYVQQGLLIVDNGFVKITSDGQAKIQEFDYVVYVHEHPKYCIALDDFRKAQNLHNVPLNDIVWGIFNERTITYTQKCMWGSMAANYANMTDLLIEEKRFEQALEFIFATAYLETSGMGDNNELTPIHSEFTNKGWKKLYLDNGMPEIFLFEINNYYVTVPFKKVQDRIHLEWPDIKERYLNSRQIAALEQLIPFRYFEKEESFEIFRQAIEADGKKSIFRLADCTRKLKWNKPDEKSTTYFYASTENVMARIYPKA